MLDQKKTNQSALENHRAELESRGGDPSVGFSRDRMIYSGRKLHDIQSLQFETPLNEIENADDCSILKACVLRYPKRKYKMQICYTRFNVHAEAEITLQGPSEMELMF